MFARCSRDVREVREHVRQFEECSSRVSFVNSIFANKKSVRELYEHMFVNKSRFGSHVWHVVLDELNAIRRCSEIVSSAVCRIFVWISVPLAQEPDSIISESLMTD